MLFTSLIIFGVLIEPILIIFGVYLIFKKFPKPTKEILQTEIKNNITSETIRDGVKSAFQEMKYEEEQKNSYFKKIKRPEYVHSTGSPKEKLLEKSGGDLIPFGLNDTDRELLEMFYNND